MRRMSLKGRQTGEIREGEDKSGDEIAFIGVINMAVIDNLFFGSLGWDFGFKETGSCKYSLL